MKQTVNRLIASVMALALLLQGAPALAASTSAKPATPTSASVSSSPTSISTFSSTGQPISSYFQDPAFAQEIAQQLGKNVNDSVTTYELQNIQYLGLHNNQITDLSGIEYLTNLSSLNIYNTNIRQIPEEISKLSNLNSLYLSDNKLTILPTSIGSLHSLQDLSVYEPNLYKIPTSIGDLYSLQNLYISSNILSSLPTTIGQLYNLNTLSIYSPKLNTLPDTIGRLPNLETLYIGSGMSASMSGYYYSLYDLYEDGSSPTPAPIKELPSSLSNLTKLKRLSISFTSLTSVPTWVDGMHQLEELYIEGNPYITTIPSDIGNLYKLKRLSLAGNDLSTLPNNWTQLKQIDYLDISKNHLHEIPTELINLTKNGSPLDIWTNLASIESAVQSSGYYRPQYGLFAQAQKASIPVRTYQQFSALDWNDVLPPLIVQATEMYYNPATLSSDVGTMSGTLWVKHSTDLSDTRSYSIQQLLLASASGLQPNDLFKQAGTYQLTFKTENTPYAFEQYIWNSSPYYWYNIWFRANNFAGHNYTYTIEIQSGLPVVSIPNYTVNTVITTSDGQYKVTIKGDIEEQLNNGFNQLTPAQIDNQMLSIKLQNLNTNENKNATVSTINTIFAYVKNAKITGIIIYGNAKTPNGTKQTYSVLLGIMGE